MAGKCVPNRYTRPALPVKLSNIIADSNREDEYSSSENEENDNLINGSDSSDSE